MAELDWTGLDLTGLKLDVTERGWTGIDQTGPNRTGRVVDRMGQTVIN
jgi:hypothetical protein